MHAKQAQRGGRGIALLILDPGARKGWVVIVMLQLLYSQEGGRLSQIQEGGPHSWFGWVQKIPFPLGFEPWTVMPIKSFNTNCAVQAGTKLKAVMFILDMVLHLRKHYVPIVVMLFSACDSPDCELLFAKIEVG